MTIRRVLIGGAEQAKNKPVGASRRVLCQFGFLVSPAVFFVRFHGLCHPEVMGAPELEAFLTDMAKRGVSSSIQSQAINTMVFLVQQVLGIESGDFAAMRARRTRRGPVVLTPDAVRGVPGATA